MTGWADYQPYVPPHAMPHAEMTRKQAKESYEHLMAARPERRQQLSSLLAVVVANPADPERLRNVWYAVVNDIALFLGDTVVSRAPTLRWDLFLAGKPWSGAGP